MFSGTHNCNSLLLCWVQVVNMVTFVFVRLCSQQNEWWNTFGSITTVANSPLLNMAAKWWKYSKTTTKQNRFCHLIKIHKWILWRLCHNSDINMPFMSYAHKMLENRIVCTTLSWKVAGSNAPWSNMPLPACCSISSYIHPELFRKHT